MLYHIEYILAYFNNKNVRYGVPIFQNTAPALPGNAPLLPVGPGIDTSATDYCDYGCVKNSRDKSQIYFIPMKIWKIFY